MSFCLKNETENIWFEMSLYGDHFSYSSSCYDSQINFYLFIDNSTDFSFYSIRISNYNTKYLFVICLYHNMYYLIIIGKLEYVDTVKLDILTTLLLKIVLYFCCIIYIRLQIYIEIRIHWSIGKDWFLLIRIGMFLLLM